ncbi:hypothetical protein BC831DRAFT_458506 [Entophlyctis helioformis]|nr:hypothetical protein BC831DRAFT_458506 [Entophlyctis helioformis]
MLTHKTIASALAALSLIHGAQPVSAAPSDAWETGRCTYHPYEEDKARLGASYDNSPAWCGIRYSALNAARIVAVNGLGTGMCAQCIEFRGANGGPSMFVLAVDQKGDPGLDVARSSFQAAFPGSNPLDPQVCAWRIVAPSNCAGVCFGSASECTPGVRNMLPANLLPPIVFPSHQEQAIMSGNTTNHTANEAAASPSTTSITSLSATQTHSQTVTAPITSSATAMDEPAATSTSQPGQDGSDRVPMRAGLISASLPTSTPFSLSSIATVASSIIFSAIAALLA